MQTSSLPTSTCESLDKCNRQFLWGSTEEQRKIPLVAWDVVCTPKTRGGLGIRHTSYYNQAHLMKIGWNLSARREDLWVKVIRNKYGCGSDTIPKIEMNRPGSNLWRGIKRTWSKIQEGTEVLPSGGLRWRWSKNGMFTVKSAYDAINNEVVRPDPIWGKIWKLQIPERCKMFLWLATHKRLLTNESRCKRGLSIEDRCTVCNGGIESLIHVLRDCPSTTDLWKHLVPVQLWHKFFSLPFDQWVRFNICHRGKNQRADEWRHLFGIVCWWLWRRRNSVIFEGKAISNESLQRSSMAMINSLQDARSRFCMRTNRQQGMENNSGNHWKLPPPGTIKINTDGAFSHYTPGIASGGLLRDDHGSFLRGFMFKGHDGDSITAELWGCIHGLKLAWDMGYRDVILEIDSADVADLIRNPSTSAHEDGLLLEELKGVVQRRWKVDIKLISRWANAAADYLAKVSLSSLPGFQVVLHADLDLERLLTLDKS